VLCDTNHEPQHHDEFHMDDKTLQDVKLDIVDSVNDNLDRIKDGELDQAEESAVLQVAALLKRRDPFIAKEIREHQAAKKSRSDPDSTSDSERHSPNTQHSRTTPSRGIDLNLNTSRGSPRGSPTRSPTRKCSTGTDRGSESSGDSDDKE